LKTDSYFKKGSNKSCSRTNSNNHLDPTPSVKLPVMLPALIVSQIFIADNNNNHDKALMVDQVYRGKAITLFLQPEMQ
jgi:hypothetical protein